MGVNFPGKKRYEGVRFNVISVTRGSTFQEKSVTKVYGSTLLALQEGVGVSFPGKKRYEGVRFNIISVTREVGVNFPGKKRYITREWPLTSQRKSGGAANYGGTKVPSG